MKNSKTVTLNDRGLLLLGGSILLLTFGLGFMTSESLRERNVTVFSRTDLERIVSYQQFEDTKYPMAEIYAYKDRKGNLMIGCKYDNSDEN